MKKILFFLVPLMAIIFSCRTTKKVQTIQTAITKKDTTQVITVKESPRIDSSAIIKSIMGKVMQKRIDFNTFSAKVKTDYESAADSKSFSMYLYMKKDSVIYLRLVGSFLGITKEGFVVRITKDSVTVVNKIDKVVQYRSIAYLQEVTQIPFDFTTLQDMFIGNPVFIDSNIVSYRAGDAQLSVLMVGKLFKHLVTLDNADYKVLHSKLDDVDDFRNRTCDISFSKYEEKAGFNFSTYREISVAEKSKLNIWLDFKQYSFNEPLTYMFNIPKNYKKQ
jgi:hypothetical protein